MRHKSPAPSTRKALADAARRWGLRDAPPSPQKPDAAAVQSIRQAMGTPLGVARALIAKHPPREWTQALRELSPVSDAHSFLIFAWKEPLFDPDHGRWCLYEAIPEACIETARRYLLSGTPYWDLPTAAERAERSQLVSAFQWEMYQRHRWDVRPFWCLQGTEGGTPLHLTSLEQRFLRMQGKSDRPRAVGELPYAPWDDRVRRAVLRRDRLMALGRSVDALKATGTSEAVRIQREAAEREFRRVQWDWMSDRLAPRADELRHFLKTGYTSHMRRQSKAEARAAEDAKDVFIETGRLPDPVQYDRN
jgi:hypothetical protein